MIKTLGERDISAQEAMHLLLSLKLYSSTFFVIPVNLDGSRRIKVNYHSTDSQCTEDSLLDQYANRNQYQQQFPDGQFMTLNFLDFTRKYKIVSGRITKRTDNTVLRVFPTYSGNPKRDTFPLYCKYQLLRYKPWKETQSDAWENENETDALFIAKWSEFLRTPYAANHVPDWVEKLENLDAYFVSEHSEEENQLSASDTCANSGTREEWMILSDLRQPFDNHSLQNSNYNWCQDRSFYTCQQIGEMPSWIEQQKKTYIVQQNQILIDTATFNTKQSIAFNIVKMHYQQENPKEPLLLIILGEGGTGKSYVINALRNLLGQSCAVAAPTGKAAYNVQGVTLHSLLKLPVGPRGHKDLKGQSLKQLQQQFEKIQYIVIDEFSMLGQAMFGWVDNRLRQATAKTDELLGGISVILTGDLAQLPPVGDKSLYHTSPTSQIGQQGQFVYHLFNKVVLLTENNRVTGNDVN